MARDKNNYATKMVNVYIFYDLDYWPSNTIDNFTLKNCSIDATNTVKIAMSKFNL